MTRIQTFVELSHHQLTTVVNQWIASLEATAAQVGLDAADDPHLRERIVTVKSIEYATNPPYYTACVVYGNGPVTTHGRR